MALETLEVSAVEKLMRGWYETWNAGDKDAWLEHWKTCAPGEPTMEDPVGTPIKRGWDLASELWDRSGGKHHPKVLIQQLITGGSCEAVAVCHNEGMYKDRRLIIPSVDYWRVNPDGTSIVRAFWELPDGVPYAEWTRTTGSR